MRRDIGVIALALTLASLSGACKRSTALAPAPSAPHLVAAPLCVSAGAVEVLGDGHLHVDTGGMRGQIPSDFSRTAELAFTYGGASRTSAPLANGELRRQIGLKLRARDTCNVVYVMWRIEPTAGVFVSVKRNPGMSTHAECGDRGYENVRGLPGAATAKVTSPLVGSTHTLRAVLGPDDRTLHVLADGTPVFEAVLPEDALAFDGPAGVRSDNGRFDFELRVPPGGAPIASCESQR